MTSRREFIGQSVLLGGGLLFADKLFAHIAYSNATHYTLFKNPDAKYRPFVRWWWNGNKIEVGELMRELKLLKDVGIGGVEINPIAFPSRTDDMGKRAVRWLSDEWIDLVKQTCEQARTMDMTCDLIVGSGWPFGSEDLKGDERAQAILVYAEKVEGPMIFESTHFGIAASVDPGVTDKNGRRSPEILSLKLSPDPINNLDEAKDYSHLLRQENIKIEVPEGKHVIYALVKFDAFATVINGAPGASGSILNHLNKQAVEDYLNRMSDTMQRRIGPLSNYIRALFTDSMELEGSNWCTDFAEEFERRCGYDLMPYLPFILFKVGRLGAVVDEKYGAEKSLEFAEKLKRVRFDYEFTKATLFKERFTDTYLAWCKKLKVKSRAQAYGRGFFPLETSLGYDIPEGESWTTNWLRHKLGEEMSNEDYRRGRGYTMINKYVSSAAHLSGKRLVSCEEMTNTYLVFNETLELLKLGSDQSIMSGITHSVWHGFNYSPPDAAFPGWVQYGSYYNEKNNWWPYFKYLNTYKGRLSSQLQNADQYADMAILPANFDLWAESGVQTDPFPEKLNIQYTSIIWESINKCGGSADYVTESILQACRVKDGQLTYGNRAYKVLFLPELTSIGLTTLQIIASFLKSGGKVVCIEKFPEKALGIKGLQQNDIQVQLLLKELKQYTKSFVLVKKPQDNHFLAWYADLQQREDLPKYLSIESPNLFFMQNRYIRDDGSEFYFFQNAHRFERHQTRIRFDSQILKNKRAWVWDVDTGERFNLQLDEDQSRLFDFGPTESLLIVLDTDKSKGNNWRPLPVSGINSENIDMNWQLELRYSLSNKVEHIRLDRLLDFKDSEALSTFSGTAVYRKKIIISQTANCILNLGTVFGISEVYLNGKELGVKWYGQRIYNLASLAIQGENDLEIHVVTTMGNHLKTMQDNEAVQHWVNRKGREQEIQSMGIVGPVQLYEI